VNRARLLIAGIGNIFLGDDGFGCEVAQRLRRRDWPPEIQVEDFGIRGLDLAYALLDGYETAILIDALPQNRPPGSVTTLELEIPDAGSESPSFEAHGMHPLNVLRMVRALGGTSTRILLVGCEPVDFGDETEGRMGLSEPVSQGVEQALVILDQLIAQLSS
jgi:hydrogenase maturation protease